MTPIKVTKQIIQEVEIVFPFPSYWRDKTDVCYAFLSPELLLTAACVEYYVAMSIFKPSKRIMQDAVTEMERITEDEFFKVRDDARRRIDSMIPESILKSEKTIA